MNRNSYHYLIDPLLEYTYSKFGHMTEQQIASARLVYEIIREAICDLNSPKKELQTDARSYFDGNSFEFHCRCVGIPLELMLFIVDNPDKYVAQWVPTETNLDSRA